MARLSLRSPSIPRAATQRRAAESSRDPTADPRWPALTLVLAELRAARRRAVRIVDVDCGDGALLLAATREARALGFVAIEARGIDGAPALIARARAAAAARDDPAIGFSFDCADMVAALLQEHDLPADLVLAPDAIAPAAAVALARAGDRVIAGARA